MKIKDVLTLNLILFISVFFSHLVRIIIGAPVFIGEFAIPMWASVMAVIFLGFLIPQNYKALGKITKKLVAKIIAGVMIVDASVLLVSLVYGYEYLGFTKEMFTYSFTFDCILILVLLWYGFSPDKRRKTKK